MTPRPLHDPDLDVTSSLACAQAPATGRIVSVNVSAGGVPKLPTPAARVTTSGREGDRQRDRRYHGAPQRALCLYSLERIHALQREGHPIVPGSTGENVTIEGLDWSLIIPGVRVTLGDAEVGCGS